MDYESGIWYFDSRHDRFDVMPKGSYTDWAATAIQESGVALNPAVDYQYHTISKSEVTAKIVPQ